MREVVGKSKIDEALTTGKAQIQQDTQVLLQTILDQYQAGVQIAAVQLQDVRPAGSGCGGVQRCDERQGGPGETDQSVSELSQRHSSQEPKAKPLR